MLEAIWGEGWLSPAGRRRWRASSPASTFAAGRCSTSGAASAAQTSSFCDHHGAGHVTGIDVEETVWPKTRGRAYQRGRGGEAEFVKVAPGPLPFASRRFDIVFSKDSIVHMADKHALMAEVYRVLKPGGWFAASDWLIGHDGAPSAEMRAYIAAEGLDFGMASPARYRDATEKAGFEEISDGKPQRLVPQYGREELARLKGSLYPSAVTKLGREFVDHNIEIWGKMLVVLKIRASIVRRICAAASPEFPQMSTVAVAEQAQSQRKASKEVRRHQLIEATIDTLARKGYAALTLADVAKTAGLSVGIVNFHFDTKEKLLVETLKYLAEQYRAQLERGAQAGRSDAGGKARSA